MRKFLIALALLFAPAAAWAQPTLDVTAGVRGTATASSISSFTLTTTQTNDTLFLVVSGSTTTTSGAVPTVSVAGCSLTWTRRSRQAALSSGNTPLLLETWTAQAATVVSSCAPVATFSASTDDPSVVLFAVNGAGAFDSNAALPAAASNMTATSTTPTANLSTTATAAFVVSIGFVDVINSSVGTTLLPTGYTSLMAGSPGFNWSNSNPLTTYVGYKTVTSAQSAVATSATSSWPNWFWNVDALVAGGAAGGSSGGFFNAVP